MPMPSLAEHHAHPPLQHQPPLLALHTPPLPSLPSTRHPQTSARNSGAAASLFKTCLIMSESETEKPKVRQRRDRTSRMLRVVLEIAAACGSTLTAVFVSFFHLPLPHSSSNFSLSAWSCGYPQPGAPRQ
eukprot:1436719-Rhodomonas_salina.1